MRAWPPRPAEGDGPLSEEFTRLLQELRFGLPRSEALDNLLTRADVPELRQLVHDVIQAETYVLPVHGDRMGGPPSG